MRRLPRRLNPLGRRVVVPLSLDPVTSVGEEVDPSTVGLSARAVGTVWAATQAIYRTGLHPGVSIVVRHHGETVLSRGLGHRVWGGPEPMTPDTPTCLFSCSKSVTAVVVHRLAELGVLELDAAVASYLPEFGVDGKQDVTLRSLLTHRAGLAALPVRDPDPRLLFEWQTMLDLLCEAPLVRPSRQAYHAVTAGYILGEVAQRATGESLRDLLRKHVAQPLGRDTVWYGVPADRRDEVALSYSTGPEFLPPLSQIVHRRLLGLRPHVIAEALNLPEAMDAIVPAANAFASATDMAALFQMLLDRGRWQGGQVLGEATVAEAVRPAGPLVLDGAIPLPMRFSAGFMLGERTASLFGVNTPAAFGHLGFTTHLCWADPDRDLAVALLTTGKAVSPEGFVGMLAASSAISAAVPRGSGGPGRSHREARA